MKKLSLVLAAALLCGSVSFAQSSTTTGQTQTKATTTTKTEKTMSTKTEKKAPMKKKSEKKAASTTKTPAAK